MGESRDCRRPSHTSPISCCAGENLYGEAFLWEFSVVVQFDCPGVQPLTLSGNQIAVVRMWVFVNKVLSSPLKFERFPPSEK